MRDARQSQVSAPVGSEGRAIERLNLDARPAARFPRNSVVGGQVPPMRNATLQDVATADRRQTLIRPWSNLLERTIATDVLPRMLANRASGEAGPQREDTVSVSDAAVERLLTLILADEMILARRMVDLMAERGTPRDVVLHGLLAVVARRLGELWEQDQADFAAVTFGMIRLNQLMRDTAEVIYEGPALRGRERHLLIAAAPGEQHSFGVAVIADLFRRAGWFVQSEPVMTRQALMTMVRRNWFDVVGLSVSADRGLKGLPAVIRAMRRTALNQALGVMVGGKVFVEHPERAQFVGADATARDGQEALYEANALVERSHALPA